MFRIRSNRFSSIRQMCFNCLDHRRSIAVLILMLFIMPTFYFIHSPTPELPAVEQTDICSKLLEVLYNSNRSLCSRQADQRGNHQRIISIAIFGPQENPMFVDEKFAQLIYPFINEAQTLFPSWTIRLYADEKSIERLNLNNLTHFASNIDICNVNALPVVGNLGEYLSGKLWRFIPALDPTVDFVSSRDLDSPLIERERLIIKQFLRSNYLFLTIRDHPLHGIPILGGLWTSALSRNRLLFLHLFSILLDKNKVKRYALSHDQTLLTELVWPKIKEQALVFDSYTCEQWPHKNWRPFPSQRPSRECHLGCVRPCCQNSTNIVCKKPCPEQCRPKNHPDWIYC